MDVVAAQLGIEDPSCVKRYTERDKTRLEHTWEIAKAFGLKDFASGEAELAGKVRAHAWNTSDGPTACFQYAVRWLRRERRAAARDQYADPAGGARAGTRRATAIRLPGQFCPCCCVGRRGPE
ncbi:DUF4158 domain-containing protein [Nonomuraea sp. LPB2021202275-12-8]|uniref:DUF4158 domain-containing protein n=1 Tax=Nonomuraea sp. LPB2021202275-12-8 TaxID=3120159 RepID=UPI003FA5C03F